MLEDKPWPDTSETECLVVGLRELVEVMYTGCVANSREADKPDCWRKTPLVITANRWVVVLLSGEEQGRVGGAKNHPQQPASVFVDSTVFCDLTSLLRGHLFL